MTAAVATVAEATSVFKEVSSLSKEEGWFPYSDSAGALCAFDLQVPPVVAARAETPSTE